LAKEKTQNWCQQYEIKSAEGKDISERITTPLKRMGQWKYSSTVKRFTRFLIPPLQNAFGSGLSHYCIASFYN
jgi:hypothetical protein